ncbi:MAG: HAD family phosphatase, partial [Acidiferrobacterales bacterium]
AAERLGISPQQCIVFEDAVVGVRAGHAAGMKVVGVATTNPAAALDAADRVVRRLDELDVHELAHWF